MQNSAFIGLDVHKATISVAIAQGGRGGEVRHWGTVPHRSDHLRKLVEKLAAGGAQLHFCYEAGPCGYGQDYIDAVADAEARVERLTGQIADLLPTWSLAPVFDPVHEHLKPVVIQAHPQPVPSVGLRPPSVTAPPRRLIQIDAESHPDCRAANVCL